MAITRKPRPMTVHAGAIDVDALINKGGSPASQVAAQIIEKPAEPSTAVVLRVPGELLEQIDASVKSRPIRTPRHTWLLEALHEKLSREQQNG